MSTSNVDQSLEASNPTLLGASFVDVLKNFPENSETWTRPPLSQLYEEQALRFQNVDIRGGKSNSGTSEIHIFGVTKAGHSILARVLDWDHYLFHPAPKGFTEEDLNPLREYLNKVEWNFEVSQIEMHSKRLQSGGTEFPFLKIFLSNHNHIGRLKGFFARGDCQYRGLSFVRWDSETSIPYILRFIMDKEISTMDWLQIEPDKYKVIFPESKQSWCQLEVSVSERDIQKYDPPEGENAAPLRILSFDIETDVRFVGDETQQSDASKDSVIQIGSMVSLGETPFFRAVFTLGTCSPIEGAQVRNFENESDMLLAWQEFFVEVDPDIVIGYFLTRFDIPYLLKRARALSLPKFPYLGRIKSSFQDLGFNSTTTHWNCPGYDGRLILDPHYQIRGRFPLDKYSIGSYKLNDVSRYFLNDKKEDMDVKQISILQNGDQESRRTLAIYCLKDVYLPLQLLLKLQCFEHEVNEAREVHVPYNALRVSRWWIKVAKQILDATKGDYIATDSMTWI